MISGVNHITLTVHDIDVAFNFYTTVLGMKPIMKSKRSAYFQTGDIWIAIVKGERRDDKRYDHIAWQVSKEDYNKISERIYYVRIRNMERKRYGRRISVFLGSIWK